MAFVRGLPDHSFTDRLVRGRAWIPVLGVLLVGIVAMQVSILRLNASMGRDIEQASTLQTRNGELRARVASLGSVSRIERLASQMGMVMTTPSDVTFLHGGRGTEARAIGNLSAPSSSSAAASSSMTTDTSTTASSTETDTAGTATVPPTSTTTSAAAGTTTAADGPTSTETSSTTDTSPGSTTAESPASTQGTVAGAGGATTGAATGDTSAPTDGAATPAGSGGVSSTGVGTSP